MSADSLAFLMWFACMGLVFIALALLGEFLEVRAMRQRAKKRREMERYLGLVYPPEQP